MIYAHPLILLITAAGDGAATCDPVLTALFTPLRPHVGRYEVCTTDAPLVTGRAEIERGRLYFQGHTYVIQRGVLDFVNPQRLDPLFDIEASDRARLARLYGGTRARVARSWTRHGGAIVSITRISPYPDPAFSRLNSGTLEIRFTVSRGL